MEQKLVMAHVFGHADFFKHNVWFAPTERRMLDRMAEHGTRMRRLTDRRGQDAVETFLDRALCLDNLIDPFLPMRRHMRRDEPERPAGGLAERARLAFEAALSDPAAASRPAPPPAEAARTPTFDVLGFLVERAPLEPWQKEVLRMVRDEAYYFLPQRMTKIMNEGWASFWHSRLLTGGILGAAEIVDFADCHSGATQPQPGQLNPYKLGIELFRHAERKGLDIFRLRRVHNDATFLDELCDEDFARRQQLFLFGRNTRTGRTEVVGRDFQKVREKLLGELAWGGLPRIELVEADHAGRGELMLVHHHDGRDLELAAAGETLKSLARLWQKPAHLTTREDGQPRRLSSDGEGVRSVELPKDGDGPAEKRSA
jgi:stage V sporulation protein R